MFLQRTYRFFSEIILLFLPLLFLNTCERLEIAKIVKIVTRPPVTISYRNATVSGAIIDFGEGQIVQHGHCWATHDHPSIFDPSSQHSSLGTIYQPLAFTSYIDGLMPGTAYYYCAYCYDGKETFYGKVLTFNAKPITTATITTTEITEILDSSAVSGGNITDDGGLTIIFRGVCWSPLKNPTVADGRTIDGEGIGSFVSYLTGLSSNTTYFLRAYAINEIDTTYGEERTFKTYPCTVSDIDGNLYLGIQIGEQVWMSRNLAVTHYNNGDAIPNILSDISWTNETTGAFCNPLNDDHTYLTYGRFYNIYAVRDSRKLCPEGWHMPVNAEWTQLVNFLGGIAQAGGKMKEPGLEHWQSPNEGATNESNFTALPAGRRHYQGAFGLFYEAYWWGDSDETNARSIVYNSANIFWHNCDPNDGNSVRCIKD